MVYGLTSVSIRISPCSSTIVILIGTISVRLWDISQSIATYKLFVESLKIKPFKLPENVELV